VIEKFWAAHMTNTLNAAAINVMRPQPPRQPIVVREDTKNEEPAKPTGSFHRRPSQDRADHEIQCELALDNKPLSAPSFRDA
jgi:hypothetical protein